MPEVSGFLTTTVLNTKIGEVENKILRCYWSIQENEI